MDDMMLRDGLAALALIGLAWATVAIVARRFGRNQAGATLLVSYAVSSLATGIALFLLGRLGVTPISLVLVILLGVIALSVACLGIHHEVIAPTHALDEQLAQAA